MDAVEGIVKITRALANVAKQSVFMASATRAAANEAIVRIKDCFDRSEDPYGATWESLVSRAGLPLKDTGRLKNAFVDNSKPGTIEIHNPTKYAAIHNFGGKIVPKAKKALHFMAFGVDIFSRGVTIPARAFLPDDRGLPPSWEKKIGAVLDKALHRNFKGVE